MLQQLKLGMLLFHYWVNAKMLNAATATIRDASPPLLGK
jgi:hypothetical protein